MAIYPKIQSPCPVKNQIASFMDGDMCRLCKRQVYDLSGMSDGERVAFMKGCSGEVCVSYKLRVRPALAAAALAVAAVGLPTAAAACQEEVYVTMGGIKDTANVQYIQDAGDKAIPMLPVVYESKPTAQPAAAHDAAPAAHGAVSSPAAP